jgi:hypothetical protein
VNLVHSSPLLINLWGANNLFEGSIPESVNGLLNLEALSLGVPPLRTNGVQSGGAFRAKPASTGGGLRESAAHSASIAPDSALH